MSDIYSRVFIAVSQGEVRTLIKCIQEPDKECSVKCPLCVIRKDGEDWFSLLCKKWEPPRVMGTFSLSTLEHYRREEEEKR